MSTCEIKIFRILSEEPTDILVNELRANLKSIPLVILFNLHNTTGYSILHVACSNFKGYYAKIVLDTVLEMVNSSGA